MSAQAQLQDSLLYSLQWLQSTHEYSDLSILCGNEVFRVHKAIVCPRSKSFAASCESSKDEKPKEEIELKDEEPRLVRLMIDFFYQLNYDDMPPSEDLDAKNDKALPAEPESPVAKTVSYFEDLGHEEPPPEVASVEIDGESYNIPTSGREKKKKKKISKPRKSRLKQCEGDPNMERLTTNALMYILASKFAIDDLKHLAKVKFQAAVSQDWQNLAFAHAAELVFSTTPASDQGLRSIVIQTINQHRDLADCKEIQALLDSGNGMAWELVKVLLADQPRPLEG